jgi:hypothetical protein
MEQETRDALIAICETLKAEHLLLAHLQNSHVRFFAAVKHELPAMEQIYREIPMTSFSDPPENDERIRLIDLLLSKLRKL